MNITWGLLFTVIAITIVIRIGFTSDDVVANPILMGVIYALVAMCI